MRRILFSIILIICFGSAIYLRASSQEASPHEAINATNRLLPLIKTPTLLLPVENNEINSIGNSYVYLNSVISDDDCYITGTSQTFCFQAISYTTDWDYVYYLWQRFPADWTINNVYVRETPYCVNGGTFGSFGWWESSPNEIRITHTRYHHNPNDTCSAYYCFDVTSGSNSAGYSGYAWVSWYWQSSIYGSTPYYPCSSDGYTPTGQPACDQSITPPVYIPLCPTCYLPSVIRD